MAVVVATPDSGFKSNLSRKFNTSPDGFSKSSGSINTQCSKMQNGKICKW